MFPMFNFVIIFKFNIYTESSFVWNNNLNIKKKDLKTQWVKYIYLAATDCASLKR